MRLAYALLLVSILIFARVGINLGSYSLDLSAVAMYGLLSTGLLTGAFDVSLRRAALYGLCVACAGLSLYVNLLARDVPNTSFGSLSLVLFLYLPFLFVLRPRTLSGDDVQFCHGLFLNLGFFVACAGVAQFFVQFVYRPSWLFDFSHLIPSPLRGSSHYNTTIPVGSFFKSNGFFLREPSGFGFLVALCFLMEWEGPKRFVRLGLFGLALLVSYSGTGILTLLVGALFPLNLRTTLRILGLLGAGILVFLVAGEVLNLNATLDRVGEFDEQRKNSSGYIRYIAPARLIGDTFFSDLWTPLVGHGPGSISREKQLYEFFDPTWAKLLFEYGVLGTLSFLALFIVTLSYPGLSPSVRAVLFFCWLVMGGHLLSPSNNYLVLALAGLLSPQRSGLRKRAGPFPLTRLISRPAPKAA